MHKNYLIIIIFLMFSFTFSPVFAADGIQPEPLKKFNNPLYQGQDPFLMFKDGYYYFVASSNLSSNNRIYVSKSKTMIDQGEKVQVYDFEGEQTRIFAPELFFINGKWYIYYCADFKKYGMKHLAGVLESVTDDPQGQYIDKGPLFTGEDGVIQQANDFTVFNYNNELYAVWGTINDNDPKKPQGPAIVKMDSPVKITQNRSFMPGLGGEGPRAIINGNVLWITVSMGGFAQKNYHLAAYTYKGTGDLTDRKSWKFKDYIFKGTSDVYGAGRASFVKSADGMEDFIVYHSKVYSAEDNGWRQVNIQKFTWNEDGIPNLGKPVSPFDFQNLPSGDPGIGLVYQAENAVIRGSVTTGNMYRGFQGTGYASIGTDNNDEVSFTVRTDVAGTYYLRSRYAYGVKVAGEYGSFPGTELPVRGRLSIFINDKFQRYIQFDKTEISWEKWMSACELISLPKGTNTISFKVENGDSGNINMDYIALDIKEPASKSNNLTGANNGWLLWSISFFTAIVAAIAVFIIYKRCKRNK